MSTFSFDLVECVVEEQPAPPPPEEEKRDEDKPEPKKKPEPAPAPTVTVVKTPTTPSAKKPKPPPPTNLTTDDTEKVLSRLPDRKLPPALDSDIVGFGDRAASAGAEPPRDVASTVVPFPPPAVPPPTEEERLANEEKMRKAEAARRAKGWKDRAKADARAARDQAKSAADQAKLAEAHKADMDRQLADATAEAERQRIEERKLRVLSYKPSYAVSSRGLGGETVTIKFSHRPTKATAPGQPGWWEPTIMPAPAPAGAWRVADDGVSFEYAKNTPWQNATQFTVTLPPADSVTSAEGEHLGGAPLSFQFTTPVPKVLSVWPEDRRSGVSPETPFIVAFDQDMDTQQVARIVTLKSGERSFALRTIDAAELAAKHPTVPLEGPAQRRIAVVAAERLPNGESIEFVVPPGCVSSEGPIPSIQQVTAAYITAPRFCIESGDVYLSHHSKEAVTVRFSQPLYLGAMPASVQPEPVITPKTPDAGCWRFVSQFEVCYTPGPLGWSNATVYRIEFNPPPLGIRSAFNEFIVGDSRHMIDVVGALPRLLEVKLCKPQPYSGGSLLPHCPISLYFNQKIDKADALAHVSFKYKEEGLLGKKVRPKVVSLDLATLPALVEAGRVSPANMREISAYDAGRCLLITADPSTPLPYSTNVKIVFSSGVKSLEGPEVSRSRLEETFATANPFVVDSVCNVTAGTCRRLAATFSRELTIADPLPPTVSFPPRSEPPLPPGSWSYASPTMMAFVPTVEWPGSTIYKITFNGIKSAFGEPVRDSTETCSTTLLCIERFCSIPSIDGAEDAVMPRTPVAIVFNQRVDAAGVLPHIKATVEKKNIPLRIVTPADMSEFRRAGLFAKSPEPPTGPRVVVFTAVESFPFGSTVVLSVEDGIPSLEGPVLSTSKFSYSFRVVPEFCVADFQPKASSENPLSLNSTATIEVRFIRQLWYGDKPPVPTDPALLPEIHPDPPPGQWSYSSPTSLAYTLHAGCVWPGSTEYHVVVRAENRGVRSMFGELVPFSKDTNKWEATFETARIAPTSFVAAPASTSVSWSTPHAPLFIAFDQRVDHRGVFATITAKAGKNVPLRLLDQKALSEMVGCGRLKPSVLPTAITTLDSAFWIAVCADPDFPFPCDSKVSVTLGPSIPSAEGPLLSKVKRTWEVTIGPAFKMTDPSHIGGAPNRPVLLRFNHALAEDLSQPLPWEPTVTPSIAGTWTWHLDTCAIQFAPSAPWALSTQYTVKVPSGSPSWFAEGTQQDANFTWETERITLVATHPREGEKDVPVRTPIALVFSQRVDPAKIVPKLEARASKLMISRAHKCTFTVMPKPEALAWLATMPQVIRNSLWHLTSPEYEGKWFAVLPSVPFPLDTSCSINVEKDMISEEGPLRGVEERRWSFTTCDKFVAIEKNAQPAEGHMSDSGRVVIPFSHPLTTNHLNGPLPWAAQIRLAPAPPGPVTWTASLQGEHHTLLGEPTVPWALSTQYTLTVPSGVVSGLGEPLAKDLTFQFSTRTVQLTSQFPYQAFAKPETAILMLFDQRVSMAEVARHVKFEASDIGSSKKKAFAPTSVQTLDTVQRVRDAGMPIPWDAAQNAGKWVALTVVPPCPPKKSIWVTLPPGMPCAEGPLRTPSEISFYFNTLPAFTITDRGLPSNPSEMLYLAFSQPLAATEYNPDSPVTIDPGAGRDSWVTGGDPAGHVFTRLHLTPDPAPGSMWAVFRADTRVAKLLPPAGSPRYLRYSTTYTLTVEPGAVSGVGSVLTDRATYTFSTEPLQLQSAFPRENGMLDGPIVLRFNQPVDPAAVLATVQVLVPSSKTPKKPFCGIRPVPEEQLPTAIASLALRDGIEASSIPRSNVVVFTVDKQLPSSTTIRISIGPNAPAAEGPNRVATALTHDFVTVPPFSFSGYNLQFNAQRFDFEFSQPLVRTIEALPEWVPTFEPAPESEVNLVLDGTFKLRCTPTAANGRLFRGSTKYRVSVPAGTKSAWGIPIEGTMQHTFETPTNELQTYSPLSTASINTLIFLQFSQPVDPAAVAKLVKISSKHLDVRIQLATKHAFTIVPPEEALRAARPRSVLRQVREWRAGHWVALKPTQPLPYAANVRVRIAKKLPSLEGPLVSPNKFVFAFQTHPATIVQTMQPANGSKVPQGTTLRLAFSQNVDVSCLQRAITISPPLPIKLRHSRLGRSLEITGTVPPGWVNWPIKHTVTIAGQQLTDVHGQPLKSDTNWEVTLLPAVFEASLTCPHAASGDIMTFDPLFGAPAVCVRTKNYTEFRAVLYRLDPKDDLPRWPGQSVPVTDEKNPEAGGLDYLKLGKRVFDQAIKVRNFARDAELTTWVPLAPALEDATRGVGQVGVVLVPTMAAHAPNPWNSSTVSPIKIWVQCSRIGLDVMHDCGGLTAWCTELDTGAAAGDVALSWVGSSGRIEAKSAADGTAFLKGVQEGTRDFVVARRGADSVFIREVYGALKAEAEKYVFHVFDDRSMYRPNEDVHIKGYVRLVKPGKAELDATGAKAIQPCTQVPMARNAISYKVTDGRGLAVSEGRTTCNAWGAFDFAVHLPDTVNLGEVNAALTLNPREDSKTEPLDLAIATHTHKFSVQEFRRPDFIVEVKPLSAGPHWYLSPTDDYGGIVLRVDVSYFTGGKLPDAGVDWVVASSRGTYVPPGLSAFSFDSDGGRPDDWYKCKKTLRGKTLDDGRHHAKVVFNSEEVPPPVPLFLDATASILDLSNQTISASARITVHPCSYYCGVSEEPQAQPDAASRTFRIVVSNHEGKAVEGVPIQLSLKKMDPAERELLSARIQSKKPHAIQEFPLADPKFGDYVLEAWIADERECKFLKKHKFSVVVPTAAVPPVPAESQKMVMPTRGRKPVPPPSAPVVPAFVAPKVTERELELTVNYVADSAEVTIRVPFSGPRAGILCIVGQGILRTIPFTMSGREHKLNVPMLAEWLPQVYLWASVVGTDDISAAVSTAAALRPAIASAETVCEVPLQMKALTVGPAAEDEFVEPGADTKVIVKVSDSKGRAVQGAEVALVAVDESVLALTKYQLPDPFRTFWTRTLFGTLPRQKQSSRANVALMPWAFKKVDETGVAGVSASTGVTGEALSALTRASATTRTEMPLEQFTDESERRELTPRADKLGSANVTVGVQLLEVENVDPAAWIRLLDTFDIRQDGVGVFLTYSVLDADSFDELLKLQGKFGPGSNRRIAAVFVGTKTDQYLQRRVEWEDARGIASSWDVPIHEINTASSVTDVLKSLIREIFFLNSAEHPRVQLLVIGKHGTGRSSFITKALESATAQPSLLIPTPAVEAPVPAPAPEAAPIPAPDAAAAALEAVLGTQSEEVKVIIGRNQPREFTMTVDQVTPPPPPVPREIACEKAAEVFDEDIEMMKRGRDVRREPQMVSKSAARRKKGGGGVHLANRSRGPACEDADLALPPPAPEQTMASFSFAPAMEMECTARPAAMDMVCDDLAPAQQPQLQAMPCAAPAPPGGLMRQLSKRAPASRPPPKPAKASLSASIASGDKLRMAKKGEEAKGAPMEGKKKMMKEKQKEKEKDMGKIMEEACDDADASEEEEEDEDMGADAPEPEPEEEESKEPLVLRSNFSALANFTPSSPTDAGGIATINVHFPDTIARYRIWAVAVSEPGLYGLGETSVVARLPLLVRMTVPRFLNHGDVSRIAVIVQNMTPRTRDVKVAMEMSENVAVALPESVVASSAVPLRAFGLITPVETMSRRVFVFPIRCLLPGKATFHVSCVSGAFGDAQKLSVPVYPPPLTAVPETQGEIDADGQVVRLPVKFPEHTLRGFGSLDLTVVTSALSGAFGAAAYLRDMSYSNTEQLCSQVCGLAALRDAGERYPELPAKKFVASCFSKVIKAVKERQLTTGAFSLWPKRKRSDPDPLPCPPFVSAHISACLAMLHSLGHSVPSKILEGCRTYLRRVVSADVAGRDYEHADERAPTVAYAIYALHLLWKADPPGKKETASSTNPRQLAQQFWAAHSPQELPLEAVGWLLYVLGEAPALPEAADVTEFVKEEASGGALVTSFYEPNVRSRVLHSPARTEAVILSALAHTAARSADVAVRGIIRGLVSSLSARKVWSSGQEASWAVISLAEYLAEAETESPDCQLSAWLVRPAQPATTAAAPVYCGTTPKLTGVSQTRSCTMRVPLIAAGLEAGACDMLVRKAGVGRVYWRLAMRFAPDTMNVPAINCGFAVSRDYAAPQPAVAGAAADVTFDAPRSRWIVKTGALVEVTVTVTTRSQRWNVAVVDKLPAGFEPILKRPDEEEADSAAEPGKQAAAAAAAWYQYVNMRDERAEAFSNSVTPGTHTFVYRVCATTIGVYNVGPCRVEDMYQPEIFGQTPSCVIEVIEDNN